jgi:aminoglycoside phosphotransferase (APT) family kinase protein
LARLHTSAVRPPGAPRTGAREATLTRQRAALIAAYSPAQAEAALGLAQRVAERLEALLPDAYRPTHGGFKPSQLLFRSQRVFVVDFDSFCLANPALDVGYFLAYLRPSGLWHRRPSMRLWFDGSKARFVEAYRTALLERSVDEGTTEGMLQPACIYEAATLFKIATRRAHRLNASRPGELSAMLAEIEACLSDYARKAVTS